MNRRIKTILVIAIACIFLYLLGKYLEEREARQLAEWPQEIDVTEGAVSE